MRCSVGVSKEQTGFFLNSAQKCQQRESRISQIQNSTQPQPSRSDLEKDMWTAAAFKYI